LQVANIDPEWMTVGFDATSAQRNTVNFGDFQSPKTNNASGEGSGFFRIHRGTLSFALPPGNESS
jgi:hypothetical protein